MVDSASGIVHHFDSETGIYLGKFIDASEIGAKSITDISVCACGGAIALLDSEANTIWTVDFEGSFLWKKDNKTPGLDFTNPVGIGICQDSNYEHIIMTTQSGKVFHVAPQNEPDKAFPDTYTNPGGSYMDFIKQVFIADTGAKRVVKTDEWGKFVAEIGKGILQKPVDVATSEDDDRQIWVCDQTNARLHVFSKDYKHLFDCGEGFLTNPISVIVDYIDSGAYVAEVVDGKPLIHKFDKNGVHIFTIKKANNLPVQTLLSVAEGSYVLQNRNNRALNVRLFNQPKNVDGKVYVEIRPVFESMGFNVAWDNKSRSAIISKGSFSASLPLKGNPIVDGKIVDYDGGILISKSKMMLPVSFIDKNFDVSVNASDQSVFFVSPKLLSWQTMPQPDIGKKLFEAKCSRCHQLPVPDVKMRSEWPPIVQRMMSKDPTWISAGQAEQITRYVWGQAKPDQH